MTVVLGCCYSLKKRQYSLNGLKLNGCWRRGLISQTENGGNPMKIQSSSHDRRRFELNSFSFENASIASSLLLRPLFWYPSFHSFSHSNLVVWWTCGRGLTLITFLARGELMFILFLASLFTIICQMFGCFPRISFRFSSLFLFLHLDRQDIFCYLLFSSVEKTFRRGMTFYIGHYVIIMLPF